MQMAAQKWTRETISNVIKTCKSGKDFKRRYASAFQVKLVLLGVIDV